MSWNSSTPLWRDLRVPLTLGEKEENKKNGLSLFVGHQITQSFTLYFFPTWTADHNTLANRRGKGSHRYSRVMRSVCRLLRQKLSGSPSRRCGAQRGGGRGGATPVHPFLWLMAVQRPGWRLSSCGEQRFRRWRLLGLEFKGGWYVKALGKRGDNPCPSDSAAAVGGAAHTVACRYGGDACCSGSSFSAAQK